MSWFRQPARHALAAKGVCTRFQRAQLNNVQRGNRVGGIFGRGASYDQLTKRIEKRYSEGSEVDQADYEHLVEPLFSALADADILVDKGDLAGAISRLELAEREFGSMCTRANVLNDSDAKEFISVSRMISEKAISRSRIPAPPKNAPVLVVQAPPAPPQQNKIADNQGGNGNTGSQ